MEANQEERNNPIGAAAMIDTVLRKEKNWEALHFYQKTVVLYHMTYIFCSRFLPLPLPFHRQDDDEL